MRPVRQKRERLNLRIPNELLKWAKKRALSSNSSVTQLIIDQLTKLKEKEESNGS